MPFAQLLHGVQIERVAQGMRHHDGPCLRPDGLLEPLGNGVVCAELYIDYDRPQPILDYRVDGGGESRGYGQHFIAGLQRPLPEPFLTELLTRQGAERDEVGTRPAVDEDCVAGSDISGEGAFEQRMEPACRQPTVERRINECSEIV